MAKTYCIFSAFYLPHVGGVEKYTSNLARALIGRGDKVIVVTTATGEYDAHEESPCEGLTVFRLPSFALLGGRFPIPRRDATYRRIRNTLRKLPVDYVIVNTRFYLHSLEGLRLARARRIKPVLIEHGSAHLTMGGGIVDKVVGFYEHFITAFVKRYNPVFYAVSQMGCVWLEHFGIFARGVLSNSIDAKSFRATSTNRDFRGEYGVADESLACVFVGRFVPEKGIACILEAARMLQSRSDVSFLLAGDGPMRAEVENARLSNVHCVGRLSEGDVAALLETADVFVLPSRSEGFSTSLLECAATSTPPIVTHVGGVDELVPTSEYGHVISKASADEVVSSIERFADDPLLAPAMGARLRKLVESEFSWGVTAEKVRVACMKANE